QFVIETTLYQPPDDRRIKAFPRQHVIGGTTFDAAFGERAMHPLDDIAALAQFPQNRFGSIPDIPLTRAQLVGEAQYFQLAEPTEFQRMKLVGLAVRARGKIDDAGSAGVAKKLPIELGPTLCRDLPLEAAADIEIGSWPQLQGDQISRPVPHPLLDIVARDHEVLAVIANSTDD